MVERVLLTGAAGRIGSCLRVGLRAGLRELRLSDVAPLRAEHPNETVAPADLGDAEAVARAAEGVDAIVHLGGEAGEAALDALLEPNVRGVFHVLDAARRADARRVVLASSNHVTGFYDAGVPLEGGEPVRPDSLYGVTKAFAEALGRMYADKFGLEVVCLRIGTFGERPTAARQMATWLSPGDAVRLVAACLSAPSPLGFVIAYGASANSRGWWDLGPARRLGYEPRDDAEAFAAELGEASRDEPQGAEFADPHYGGWAQSSGTRSTAS